MSTKTIAKTAVGACPDCGFVNASADAIVPCAGCGTVLTLVYVQGSYSDKIPCDDRCQYAHGPKCECTCGGDNHGVGYIDVAKVPAWVRKRDADLAAAKKAKAAEKAAAERQSARGAVDALVAEHPLLAGLLDEDIAGGNEFLWDVRGRFLANGYLSERQIEAVEKTVAREQANRKREAERAAAKERAVASGFVAPTGTVAVAGQIAAVKSQPGYAYNSTEWKMLVRCTDAATGAEWTVWSTVPRTLITWATDRQEEERAAKQQWRGWSDILKEQTVEFTAALEEPAREADNLHRFAKRPKGARVLAG